MATTSKTKEVFLSYGREPEVAAFVKQLKLDLETRGISVWLDTDDIPAGSDWHGAIGTGLQQSRALIAVITTKYINSKFCTNELYIASSDQKDIYPIMLETIDFSASERARGVKYVIGSINWTMFGTGYDYQMSLERLVQGMKEHGLGGGNQVDGPVTDMMATMHISPNTTHHPSATAPPPPHSSPRGNYHSPSQMYYNTPPHVMPSPQQAFFPYSPPQGHGGVYSSYPYPYPVQTPSPTSYPYYSPNAAMAMHAQGVVTPPPPYTATDSTDAAIGEAAVLPKTPISASQEHYPSAPPRAQVTPTELHTQQHLSSQPGIGTTTPPDNSPPSFKVGMKLEAVDRRFPYFVCVATIMDRTDFEVLIHFDGWGSEYDYWCAANSLELHPPGWCKTHNWELQTPLNQSWTSWEHYLEETDSPATPESLFNQDQLAGLGSLLFQPNMKLEAKDRQNPHLTCVATIANIKDGRLLIHFDGWTQRYDYWCRPGSTDIHPSHWCGKNHMGVHPPHGHSGPFKWSEYLRQPGPIPAPAHIFTEEQRAVPSESSSSVHGFKVGMRLEAKDRQYPTLTCVATISEITGNKLLIHFDGWGTGYDYLCEPDSPDIHPVGWSQRNGRTLQKPNGYNGEFQWNRYLSQNGYVAAPLNLFSPVQTRS